MKTLIIMAGFAAALIVATGAYACGTCGCDKDKAGHDLKAVPSDETSPAAVAPASRPGQSGEPGEGTAGSGEEVKAQTKCPVKGLPISKERFVDYKGKRVYFCCSGCDKKFLKDPDKYLEQMKEQGVTLEESPKTQTTCPVMGGKVNRDIFVDHDGKRVYLCCKACVKAVKADPEKYIKKLEEEGVVLDKVPEENPKEM